MDCHPICKLKRHEDNSSGHGHGFNVWKDRNYQCQQAAATMNKELNPVRTWKFIQ